MSEETKPEGKRKNPMDAVRQRAIEAFNQGAELKDNPYPDHPHRGVWFRAFEDAQQIDWIEMAQ